MSPHNVTLRLQKMLHYVCTKCYRMSPQNVTVCPQCYRMSKQNVIIMSPQNVIHVVCPKKMLQQSQQNVTVGPSKMLQYAPTKCYSLSPHKMLMTFLNYINVTVCLHKMFQ
jgi:ribosomal protein L40E